MNSRMMKLVMIVMVAMMATGSVAFAQRGEGKGMKQKGEKGEMIHKVIQRLNLTEGQQAQIKSIHSNFKSANAGNMEQMKALRTQMKEARKSGNTAEATTLKEQMKAKMQAMRPAREQMMADIKAVLTPEQRAEAEKMLAEKKGRKGDRGAKGAAKAGGQAKQKAPARID